MQTMNKSLTTQLSQYLDIFFFFQALRFVYNFYAVMYTTEILNKTILGSNPCPINKLPIIKERTMCNKRKL